MQKERSKKLHKIQRIKIDEIIPYENNPRDNKNAIDKVAESIKEFGFTNPILLDKDNVVIAGHTRLEAAKKLNLTEVDCVYLDLTEEQAKAYRLVDNKTAEFAEWDLDLLNIELEELSLEGFNMDNFGFDFNLDFKDDGETLEEDDFDAEEVESIVKRSEIYRLGEHVLMCGDSTNAEDVMSLRDAMGDDADLIVTNPPYNVNYEGTAGKIKNDNMDDSSFKDFLFEAYSRMYEISKKGAGIYVFHADFEGVNFRQEMVKAGFLLKQCCVWVKNSMVMGRQDYQWQHEPVLYGWKEGATHHWYSDRKQKTVWNFDKPSRNGEHPTMKPIDLIGYPIKNSSKKGDVVLDLFGGSGSTLIACEQLGRRCMTMELDEKYASVILKRWEELTGECAERIK